MNGPLPSFVARLVDSGEVSAGLALVATSQRIIGWASAGTYDGKPVPGLGTEGAPGLDARFDLASLTKPIVATLALALDQQGLLPLTTRVAQVWPNCGSALGRRALGTLWRHRAGLAPWTPLGLRCADRTDIAELILTADDLHQVVPGTYSDLGPILWGLAAERVLETDLATLIGRHLTTPLGLQSLVPSPGPKRDVVACCLDNTVERRLAAAQGLTMAVHHRPARGEVQDGNARFLGGLGGHAGLFGSARDLWRFAACWLEARPPLSWALVETSLAGRGAYALGWARRRVRGSAGPALSLSSFGHTGFVGNSLWLDPVRDRIAILLAHRRHSDGDFNAIRRAFHELAAAAAA